MVIPRRRKKVTPISNGNLYTGEEKGLSFQTSEGLQHLPNGDGFAGRI